MQKLKLQQLNRVSIAGFKSKEKLPVTLILDSVRSMNNVGSVFRTADAFAVQRVYLCGITGRPPHREIEKTALGATQSVEWFYEADLGDAIRALKQSGYQILAIEQATESIRLSDFEPLTGENYALIFGNEVNGVSDEAMQLADACIEIPQFGTKHSFNIAVTAGIVLWDLYSKLRLNSL